MSEEAAPWWKGRVKAAEAYARETVASACGNHPDCLPPRDHPDQYIRAIRAWGADHPLARAEGGEGWATATDARGVTRVLLDRLADGRVMCCLCFEFCAPEELTPDEDGESLNDVCRRCSLEESRARDARGR